jgi:aminobenzoyl-glutamate transport protein
MQRRTLEIERWSRCAFKDARAADPTGRHRIGDSPPNVLTPLMVYFPFIVTLAQRYKKDAGVGAIISIMLPYAVIMLIAGMLLFALWFLLGVPLGPGYPVR